MVQTRQQFLKAKRKTNTSIDKSSNNNKTKKSVKITRKIKQEEDENKENIAWIPPTRTHEKKTIYSLTKYSSEQVAALIRYIVYDKMSVKDASDKAGIVYRSAIRYYNTYLRKGQIPDPYIGSHAGQKIHEEHTQFIKELYRKNRMIKSEEVLSALNNAFPDLDVGMTTLKVHLYKKMYDVYKTSGTANKENTRKLFDTHIQFIANLLKNQPDLTLKKIRVMLHEAYPGLHVDPTTVARYVHIYLEHLYKKTKSYQNDHNRKIFQKHIDFADDLIKKNPNIKREQVFQEVTKAFPDFKAARSSLYKNLCDKLGEETISHIRVRPKLHNFRKLYPEHTRYITGLFLKNPAMQIRECQTILNRSFPCLNISHAVLRNHIRRKCGISLMNINVKKVTKSTRRNRSRR